MVLSIEEHCKISQQKMMAQMLRDVFQDKLLTEPLEPEADQLKGKIIIKVEKALVLVASLFNICANDVIEVNLGLSVWQNIQDIVSNRLRIYFRIFAVSLLSQCIILFFTIAPENKRSHH